MIATATVIYLIFSIVGASEESEFHIKSASDLIEFSRNPSSFEGTVFLDSDIDFSEVHEQIEPISNYTNCFVGTFDGQGHKIRNLAMNSSSDRVGLFGYSKRITIRNVVLGESCSITSSYRYSSNAYIGGIIGKCNTENGPCIIESSVNMATLSFNENCSDLFFGGIIGETYFGEHSTTIKNCVNYGNIIDVGVYSYNHIGGITGAFTGSENEIFYIQNCVNYGVITINGTTFVSTLNYARTGGIIGETGYTSIENCLSAGEIRPLNLSIGHIGGVSGNVNNGTSIIHCFWTSDMNYSNACGLISGEPNVNISKTRMVELNSSTLEMLNEYASENDTLSKWVFNPNEKTLKFMVNNKDLFSFSSKLIILPDLFQDKENSSFSGWYTGSDFTFKFNSSEITEDTTLYGLYGLLVNVELDLGYEGASPYTKIVAFNTSYGDLPAPTMADRTFTGWFNDRNESVTSETIVTIPSSHSLHARWEINKYGVVFDLGNGTVIESVFNFNETIVYPNDIKRKGYTFDKWIPNPELMPGHNLTIKANWSEVTQYVEVRIEKKDLTKKEAEKIISGYADEAFVIEKFEVDAETGEARIIIKFVDKEQAESFIEMVKASGDEIIKRVNVIPESAISFSVGIVPMAILPYLVN